MELLQESLDVWKYLTHNLLKAKQFDRAVSECGSASGIRVRSSANSND